MIDLNADLGEHYGVYRLGNDERLMPYITSANIACGFHAGDADVMDKTVKLCKKYGVRVGAHPGYEDLKGFGRRNIPMTNEALVHMIVYQVGAMQGVCDYNGVVLTHVKPHGALYNYLADNFEASYAVANALKSMDKGYILYGLSGSETERAASTVDIPFYAEVFSDRGYTENGRLVDRRSKEAFIEDVDQGVERMVKLVETGCIESVSGSRIKLAANTICLHGDGEHALEFAEKLHRAFYVR